MTPAPPPAAPFAAPIAAPDDDVTTTQVGRYELLLKLAVGGMGSVYVGRQRGAAGFERLVAVKRMHSHIAQTPEMLGAFLDEARIASLIHHSNVVRVQDVYEAEGECLLVMDYVDGVALSGLLWSMRRRSERLPPRVALRVMVDALLGLHAAHELRNLGGAPMHVVHRDVSPHNVLLGAEDGVARVTLTGANYPDLAAVRPELPAPLAALVTRAHARPGGRGPPPAASPSAAASTGLKKNPYE